MDADLFDFVELGFENVLAPPSIVWVVLVKLDWANQHLVRSLERRLATNISGIFKFQLEI